MTRSWFDAPRLERFALLTVIAAISLSAARALGSLPEVNAQSPQPVVLASGQFGGVDGFHKGEGKALVVQLPDGERFVRFESFKVTNGPDLYVYLSGHPAPRNSGELHEGSALEVARLKGNIGNQNYPLPARADISKFKSVVIYCKQFGVIFSTAELASNR